MIRLLFFSLIFLFISACEDRKAPTTFEEFKYHLLKSVMTSSAVEPLLKANTEIERPPLIQVDVLKILTQQGEQERLQYLIPSFDKAKKGKIIWNGSKKITLTGITKFLYKIDKELTLVLEKDGEKSTIKVPLFNLKRKEERDLLTSSSQLRYLKGMSMQWKAPRKNLKTYKFNKEEFFQGKAKACRKVNNDCQLEYDRCSQCEDGFFEVVGKYNCTQGGDWYCGNIKCGQKNSPACRRFFIPLDENEIICNDNNPYFFCEKDLSVYCVNDQLVCL